LDDVVTQPYDKISPGMLRRYLRKDPRNIARVIKNTDYADAARHLTDWIESGVLRRDGVPSFYPYRQVFEIQGQSHARLGFIGLISLDEADLAVRGHERVLRGPLQDRLNLIRHTESNEGLIFMLYSDPGLSVDRLLARFTESTEPVIQVQDEYGVHHQLWQLTQSNLQAEVTAGLMSNRLYIADGHHRFQTSVEYRNECLAQGWRTSGPESFDKRMIGLFNMESPGLKVLATHRGIKNVDESRIGRLRAGLEPFFQVDSVAGADDLISLLAKEGHRSGLVLSDSGHAFLLRLRDQAHSDPVFMPAIQGPARSLDVNILHEGILNPLLGIGAEELSSQNFVEYFRDPGELISKVKKGELQAGFLLNATRLGQVREISDLSQKMPQKSTDFYPKLLTGLVLMKMEMARGPE
jgi:uncharacterized protein (DUF1015 family)